MNVYIAKPDISYAGGVVIIAANSIEEATKFADEAFEWIFSGYKLELFPDLQSPRTEPGILIDETYFE